MKNTNSSRSGPTHRTIGPDHRTTGVGSDVLRTVGPDHPDCCAGTHRTGPGGQHASAQGYSTRDLSDRESDAAALADFMAAWEEIRYGCVADRAW